MKYNLVWRLEWLQSPDKVIAVRMGEVDEWFASGMAVVGCAYRRTGRHGWWPGQGLKGAVADEGMARQSQRRVEVGRWQLRGALVMRHVHGPVNGARVGRDDQRK